MVDWDIAGFFSVDAFAVISWYLILDEHYDYNRWNFNRADFIMQHPKDDNWKKCIQAITNVLGDVVIIIPVEAYVCQNNACDLCGLFIEINFFQS